MTTQNANNYSVHTQKQAHSERYLLHHVPGRVAMETPGWDPFFSQFKKKEEEGDEDD